MSFLIALGLIVGIVSGLVSLIEFLKSRKLPGTIYGVIAVGMIIAAILVSILPSVSGSSASGVTLTPTSSNTQQKAVITSTPIQAPKFPPSPTLQIPPTSSSTAADGTFTENKLLTCSSCSSDPIQFIIDSITIDNANGRTVWNVTLKNVSGSYYYVYNNQDITLQASAGTNPPVPATGYSVPQMAPGEKDTTQLIFAFVPREGVEYTFSAHIYTNTNIDMPFDPVNFTF
jgi:hypothetical protein